MPLVGNRLLGGGALCCRLPFSSLARSLSLECGYLSRRLPAAAHSDAALFSKLREKPLSPHSYPWQLPFSGGTLL